MIPRAIGARPSLAVIGVAGVLSVLLGLLVAYGGPLAYGLLIGLPLVGWLAYARPGLAVGVVWLAALNGIPLINVQSGVGQLKPTDLATIAIVLIAGRSLVISPPPRARLPTGLSVACGLLGLWWFFTFFRSLNAGVPPIDAFFFGRDFLSLIVLIGAGWVVLQEPKAWRECVWVIIPVTGIYSLAYVAGALGLINAASFTHPTLVLKLGNVQRIYAPMNDLVIAVAIFSTAVLVTTKANRATPFVALLAAITLLVFLLQLTRAYYLSMALGALIAVVIALTRGAELRRTMARRLSIALVGVFFFAVIALGSRGAPTSVVSQRVSSGLTEFNERSGTVGYRVSLYHRMFGILGSEWPVGLGFLHPKDRYFPDLPEGSIRNADVGLMNAVMTMGALGLALLVAVFATAARHVWRTRARRPPWLVIGLFAWLTVLAAGSPTLVTLFGATGILSTALTLVLCCVDTPRGLLSSDVR
jgi:hypothetical protein